MNAAFQPMSEKDFAELGTGEVVYIRPVMAPDGTKTFDLHGADGEKLASIDSYENAISTAWNNEMHPVSLH